MTDTDLTAEERARAALRHSGPCSCFQTYPAENYCSDGICQDAVGRITKALQQENRHLHDQLANYDWADRGSFNLPDAQTAIEVITRLSESKGKQ